MSKIEKNTKIGADLLFNKLAYFSTDKVILTKTSVNQGLVFTGKLILEGTVFVIKRDHLFPNVHARFTTITFKPL